MIRRCDPADARGATAVEFAIVAPVFLSFVFLMLDGGRMLFTKQALNELAVVTARCAAIRSSVCPDKPTAEAWAATRGRIRSRLALDATMVTVTLSGPCNGQANMTKAVVSMPWKQGAMALLPQKLAPATLSATACFPTVA